MSLFDKPPVGPNVCVNDPVANNRPVLATLADTSTPANASVGSGHTLMDALSSGLHNHGSKKGNVAN